MKEILQQIEEKKQELEDALDAEEPNQSLIDSLQREIAALEQEYTQARDRISAAVEAAKEGSANGQGEKFELSRLENMKELGHEIPGLESASDPPAEDPSGKSLSGKFLEFKNTLQSIAGLDLKSKVEGLTDTYYMVEYVMDRCTYATSADRSISQFKYGEAEYILNGSENQLVNLLASYLKIFVFCYVINTIDLCLTGVPLWPAALIGSLAYTAYTMNTIYTGQKYVPLMLYLKRCGLSKLEELIGLRYSDLLYIQLFLKNDDIVLKRVKNLILANINHGDLKNGVKVTELYTQVVTEAQASVNLLFLPMLPLDDLNVSGFENGRYTIRKTFSFAYQ